MRNQNKIEKSLLNTVKNFRKSKWFIIFLVCILLAGFIILCFEIHEAQLGQVESISQIDLSSLNFFINHRTQTLNNFAKSATSLGAVLVLSVVIFLFGIYLIFKKRTADLIQLILATIGANGLTWLLKFNFERSRPAIEMRLVDVDGFSYPSGHSVSAAAVYCTIAILICKPLRTVWIKLIVWSFFLSLTLLIGATRIYLGVHFFSDVLAGVLIGIAWASLIELLVEYHKKNKRIKRERKI